MVGGQMLAGVPQEIEATATRRNLAGKVALVTGGSRGIGAAIACALAADGADVAIGYGTSTDKADAVVRGLEALGVRAVAFEADQADPAQVEALVKAVAEHFGRLDILVNNAGVVAVGAVGDPASDLVALARQVAINLGGVVAAVRAAAPLMGEGGRIISIGSTAAHHFPIGGLGDYAASKAAVAAYSRGWARDLGPRGITVNTVQPGPIDTDMNPADGPLSGILTPMTALGRYGRPEEVGAAVAFLASPSASYITGATLDVDGGCNA
jgi:3-oxoacyl-[acyl-carrier protein] reductase